MDSSPVSSLSASFSSLSTSGSSGSTGSTRDSFNPAKLVTNAYKIRNDSRAINRYSVTIDKVICKQHKDEIILLSRAGGQDAIRIPRERVCCAVMGLISQNWEDTYFLYEGSAILFTNKEISSVEKKIPIRDVQSLIEESDFKLYIRDADHLIVKITPDERMVDITEMVKSSLEENSMVADFLATLARKFAPNNRFVAYRGGKLIDKLNVKEISFGQMRLHGISMGVRAVKDKKEGPPIMALDIDTTEATIFKEQHLVRCICDNFGEKNPEALAKHYGNNSLMREVERYMRDLPVRCEYTNRTFTVAGFKYDQNHNIELWSSAVCKDQCQVEKYAGSAIVVEEMRLKDGSRRDRYFALNALYVLPGTKVPKEKQKGMKPRPILPQQRYNAMQQARKDIHLDIQNEAFKNFGTEICPDPIRVDQKRLEAPKMMGSHGGILREMRVDGIKHNWKSDDFKFVKGVKIDEMFFVFQTSGQGVGGKQADEFATALVSCCKGKGMMVGKSGGKGVSNLDELRATIEAFAAYRMDERKKEGQGEYKVFLFLLGEKNPEWHDTLKLLEQKNALLTQHIFTDVIKKILSKPAERRARDFTMFNIVMKTNLKAGGENWKIGQVAGGNSLFPSDEQVTLIVGLDVAHPPPQSRQQMMRGIPVDPSCIGISSNCMTDNLQTFTGYEVYTESRKEAATDRIMTEAGAHLMRNFIENQGRLPSNVVYFRDGVDKGQYDRVKDEFYWLMEGMKEYLTLRDNEFTPRELIVLATKRHNIRAYEVTKTGVQNVKAGTVIDMGIVSPYYPEFFLYASHALIGTARGVQCTVLLDSSERDLKRYPDWKLVDMEKFVHALAFNHQICDSPTSLPEPLYNAHECAKRGSANYKAHRNSMEVREQIPVEELTNMLSNRDTELGKVKYNA